MHRCYIATTLAMVPKPARINVTKRGYVAVIEMVTEENRLNPDFCDEYMRALDKIESWSDVKALVSTGSGRFYSNGYDLDFLLNNDKKDFFLFSVKIQELLHRLMCFPIVTIAAINGHCFGGGVLLSLCHDYRVMHNGKGWFCTNEAELTLDTGVFLEPYGGKILSLKCTKSTLRALLFATRLSAKEAFKLGGIDKVSEPGNALEEAVEMAIEFVKNRNLTRHALHDLKKQLYSHAFEKEKHIAKL